VTDIRNQPVAYYNENDPKAAAWLRELIKEGYIAHGEVDGRSIEDVKPDDLRPYTQCHFFAGIGGWSYALRLAGWPDDLPVWTGSCPCQPFSAAGKGGGFDDERHLWPSWQWLIGQCKPDVIFGEQVASKDGRNWFDLVSTDLDGLGYASGAVDLCAAGVGAPHIRQRLYFVANAQGAEHDWLGTQPGGTQSGSSDTSDVGNGRQQRRTESGKHGQQPQDSWACEWIDCTDGKARPVEPGTFPLAHGVPGRVGLLRGYGNAIVPQVAAAFIEAASDVIFAKEERLT
jgi:DNA (cytosine-5)-methyltransferase 1